MLHWWFSLSAQRALSHSQRLRNRKWACSPAARSMLPKLSSPHMMSDWLLKTLCIQKGCQVGTFHSPSVTPFEKPTSLPVSHIQELWTKQRKNWPSSFEISPGCARPHCCHDHYLSSCAYVSCASFSSPSFSSSPFFPDSFATRKCPGHNHTRLLRLWSVLLGYGLCTDYST